MTLVSVWWLDFCNFTEITFHQIDIYNKSYQLKSTPNSQEIGRYLLVLGRTWFGSEVRSVFWGSVGSRFGFWGPTRGSVGSRFGFDRKNSKNHQFFLILFSKVRGSVRFLGGSVGSRFDFKEQIRGSVGSRFDFWRFGRFEVRYFKVRPNTSYNISYMTKILK